jgi:hypothetical protein
MRILAVLLLSLFANSVWAATWYVCPIAGEYGTEDGASEANCFDGLADMAGSYASIAAGDTVCYSDAAEFTATDAQGGTTYLHYFNDSGSAGNPIVLDGDCDADGVRAVINAGATIQRAMQIADNNNLTIKNFELKNATARGLLLYNVATDATDRGAILVDNVYVHDVTGGSSPNGIDSRGLGVTVQNSTVTDIGEDGIYHKGPNFTAYNNYIERISTAGALGDCIQHDGAYLNFTWRNNYCDHTNVASKQCFIASNPTDAGYGLVVGNTCLRPQAEGVTTTYGYYVETASGTSTIERNYYRGGRTAFQVLGAGAFVLRANIAAVLDRDSATDARGLSIGASAGAVSAFNNTFWGGYEGILSDSAVAGSFRNNVITYTGDDCIDKESGDAESNNGLSFCGGDALSNDNTAGTATAAVTTNPRFLGGDTPTTAEGFKPDCIASPLKNAGTNVGQVQDFTGRFFDDQPDIGAFACQGGTPRTTPTARAVSTQRTTPTARSAAEASP